MNDRAIAKEEITDVEIVNNNINYVDRIDTDTVLHNIKAQGEIFDTLQSYVKNHMIIDQDFGTIPGCKKPSLWKPGAEKINFMFNLVPKYEILKETESNIEYTYKIRTDLYNKNNGKFMGSGLGYASSRENKFASAPANTILKMCKKRSYIDATLSSTMASFIFTQDVAEEDDTETDRVEAQKKFNKHTTNVVSDYNNYGLDPMTYKLSGGKHIGLRMMDCPTTYIEYQIRIAKESKFKQTYEKVPMPVWISFLEVCLAIHIDNKNKPVDEPEPGFIDVEDVTQDELKDDYDVVIEHFETKLGAIETEQSKTHNQIKKVLNLK